MTRLCCLWDPVLKNVTHRGVAAQIGGERTPFCKQGCRTWLGYSVVVISRLHSRETKPLSVNNTSETFQKKHSCVSPLPPPLQEGRSCPRGAWPLLPPQGVPANAVAASRQAPHGPGRCVSPNKQAVFSPAAHRHTGEGEDIFQMFGELLPILGPAQAELGLNALCVLQTATFGPWGRRDQPGSRRPGWGPWSPARTHVQACKG